MEEIQNSAFAVTTWTKQLLQNWGVNADLISLFTLLLQLTIVILLAFIFQWIARKIIVLILKQVGKLPKMELAEFMLHDRFPTYLALTVPLFWVKKTIPIVFENYPAVISTIGKLIGIFIVLLIFWIISSFLKSFSKYLLTQAKYSDKPIESYFQVIKIVVLIFCAGAIFTILSGQSFTAFFAAMGAASAIMILIFKDTILGFVASIQVSTNDMVRIGDWITIPKFNANGIVTQITLTTVKVKNFDKTISTVPTYSLISDSFQNWRGMQQDGARRIKRSMLLKQSSFRYIQKDELEKFKKIQSISSYIDERQDEINAHNKAINADRSLQVNGRNLTNIGLFRKYTENYLKNHPNVRNDLTLMVRQLEPSESGLPLEIYCFVNTTVWQEYENIMADIFDHLTSAVRYFDLKIFENLSDSGPVE